jgi:hypothetical protein
MPISSFESLNNEHCYTSGDKDGESISDDWQQRTNNPKTTNYPKDSTPKPLPPHLLMNGNANNTPKEQKST